MLTKREEIVIKALKEAYFARLKQESQKETKQLSEEISVLYSVIRDLLDNQEQAE
jgi:hypothetical protein